MSKIKLIEITLLTKEGQNVRLTLDEARDLHAQLAELFAQRNVPAQPEPIIIERIGSEPIIIERDHWPAPCPPYTQRWVSPSSGDPLPQFSYIVCSS